MCVIFSSRNQLPIFAGINVRQGVSLTMAILLGKKVIFTVGTHDRANSIWDRTKIEMLQLHYARIAYSQTT